MKHVDLSIQIITASLVLAVIFQIKPEWFFYLRQEMLLQPWRFITAHFVHVGWIHCILNMFAFICLPYIFPRLNRDWLLIGVISLPLFISTSFYVIYPNVDAYAGFSGVLHGLYVIAAIQSLAIKSERNFALLILAGLVAKLLWEAIVGELSATMRLIGSPVLIEAHQLGCIGAVCLLAIGWIFKQFNKY